MKKNPEDISIGLVSVSDRAYEGSYPDLGIPALEAWLTSAIKSRIWLEKRLIPDEYEQVEKTLHELVDEDRCSLILTTGGTGPARRDRTPGCDTGGRHKGNAGIWRTDASDQPAFRSNSHFVTSGRCYL